MAATTFSAVREALEAKVKALAPASLEGVRFALTRGEVPLVEHKARLREFEIGRVLGVVGGEVEDVQLSEDQTALAVRVAYPHTFATYGIANRQALADVIADDAHAIRGAIGMRGYGGFPDGSWPIEDEWTTEDGDGVTYLVVTVLLHYYRSTT